MLNCGLDNGKSEKPAFYETARRSRATLAAADARARSRAYARLTFRLFRNRDSVKDGAARYLSFISVTLSLSRCSRSSYTRRAIWGRFVRNARHWWYKDAAQRVGNCVAAPAAVLVLVLIYDDCMCVCVTYISAESRLFTNVVDINSVFACSRASFLKLRDLCVISTCVMIIFSITWTRSCGKIINEIGPGRVYILYV